MWIPNSLDIVIPAYKAKFLPALLQSLENQNSKNFAVIVSDDASPEPLKPICDEFDDRLRIRYVRFEQNLGATDLAGHWNRSVALSSAQWVLLPGDDDVLEKNCIESFWTTAAACGKQFDVFSFGVRVIDEHDCIIRNETQPAATSSAAQ
jgi:glycosyltransferase involved in cell wall biosynthesis